MSDLHTSVASKWYSTFFVACFFVCFVLIFIKISAGGGQLLTCHEMIVSRVLQEPLCVAPLEYMMTPVKVRNEPVWRILTGLKHTLLKPPTLHANIFSTFLLSQLD